MAKSNKADKRSFEGLTSEEIFNQFGGEMTRGGVSKAIRGLSSEGYSTGAIAKMLNKRYQHVRNVLTQPLKKTEEPATTSADESGEE